MTPAIDWDKVRAEFPSLQQWTFLNTATFGQLPLRARRAMTEHFDRRDATACHDFLTWFDDHDRLREKIARLVGCAPADVAFIPNAAAGLSMLLTGLDWKPGDEIVTLTGEFPNQIYHASVLAERGVRLREVPLPELESTLNDRTRLVLLSTVNYVTGLRPGLETLSETLHRRNIMLALDGTQSVGALEMDCSRFRPALLVVNCYKWMLTPNGAGFMVVSPELRGRIAPQVIGWRSHRTWRQVDDLHHGAPQFVGGAERYEGGMLPSSLLYAMEAVVDSMLELTPEAIERRVLDLATQCRAILRDAGATLLYDRGLHYESGIVAAHFEGRDAAALSKALKERRVLVSARHGYLRVSVHFYNNQEDLAGLRGALRDLL